MLLNRLERLFIAAAAVALVFTVAFAAGLYHDLSGRNSNAQTAAASTGAVSSLPTTSGSSSADSGAAASTAPGGTQAGPGTATAPVSGGVAAPAPAAASTHTAPGSTTGGAPKPVSVPNAQPPTVCPFPGGTMTLGQIVSLSGFFQWPEVGNAAKAFFQDANAHGGVHGCRVNLETLDDATSPSTARTAAKQLVADDHVLGVVSIQAPFGQDSIDPYLADPGADNAGQPVPTVGLDPYEESAFKFPNEFSLATPIYYGGALMAQFADQHLKGQFKHPGIFGYNVAQLAAAGLGTRDQFSKDGFTNVETQLVDPAASNYDQIAKKFQSDGVDLLMWFCDIGCGDRIVQATQSIGYFPKWINYDIGYDNGYAQRYGQQGGEEDGSYTLSHFLPFEAHTPDTDRILNTVQHYFPGTLVNGVMEMSWMGAETFASVVNKLSLSSDLHADQAAIIEALSAIRALDLGLTPPLNLARGTDPKYPNGHVAAHCVQFVLIQNGAMHWNDHSWHCLT